MFFDLKEAYNKYVLQCAYHGLTPISVKEFEKLNEGAKKHEQKHKNKKNDNNSLSGKRSSQKN